MKGLGEQIEERKTADPANAEVRSTDVSFKSRTTKRAASWRHLTQNKAQFQPADDFPHYGKEILQVVMNKNDGVAVDFCL
jgi:hypothetical protein